MNRHANAPSLHPGDIVYFSYLHVHTASKVEKHPHKENTSYFRLEGKPRPMLIVSEKTLSEQGKTWYRVAKLTTKPLDARDRPKAGYKSLGACVRPDRVSYVFLCPEWYPENLLESEREIAQLDPLEFGALLEEMNENRLLQ